MSIAHLSDNDVRHLDRRALTTPEDAREAMTRLDDIIADIAQQISLAKRRAAAGDGFADPLWLSNAERALKGARTSRVLAQDMLAELGKRQRQQAAVQMERRFVDIARKELSADVFARILNQAREAAGG